MPVFIITCLDTETGESTMAFGDKSREMGKRAAKRTEGDGEVTAFTPAWVPLGGSPKGDVIRIVHWLPEVKDGQIVMTPRLSATTGQPLREGNKKNGKELLQAVPASEVVFAFAWWKVMVNGSPQPRRLIFSADPKRYWDNPLRKHIKDVGYAADSQEARAFKLAFAANVLDLTPVVHMDDGRIFYSGGNVFNILAGTPTGKIITDNDKLPTAEDVERATPLNEIRILEGSYGKPGGRHFFAQFEDLQTTTEDSDGMLRNLTEFGIKIKVSGTNIDTSRSAKNLPRFSEPSLEVALMPRYDLETWLKPWPDDLIEQLLDDGDYNELLKDYNINPYPQLTTANDAVVEDQEELFD